MLNQLLPTERLLFIIAIHKYLKLADELITLLAKKLGYFPEDVTVDWMLKVEKTTGKFEGDWEYMFHGWECRFRNSRTGQVIDARLADYKNEQAIPDPFFFAQYVRTTDTEAQISGLINHAYHDMRRVLEILIEHKYLLSHG